MPGRGGGVWGMGGEGMRGWREKGREGKRERRREGREGEGKREEEGKRGKEEGRNECGTSTTNRASRVLHKDQLNIPTSVFLQPHSVLEVVLTGSLCCPCQH